MGQHFGRLGALVNDETPFAVGAAQANADIVSAMAKSPFAAFGPGTEKGRDTKPKLEIWSEKPNFKEHADKMQAKTVNLAEAGKKRRSAQIQDHLRQHGAKLQDLARQHTGQIIAIKKRASNALLVSA